MSARPTGIKIRSRAGRQKDPAASTNGLPHQQQVRLKVVVRHLPSSLKESEFREALKEHINDSTTDYFSWKAGKVSSDRNKPPTLSRCYIKLKTPEQITALSSALRAHGTFTDKAGMTSMPHMEYAPFQRVPKKDQRHDARVGTIEADSDFIEYLAKLTASSKPIAPVETPKPPEETSETAATEADGDSKTAATPAEPVKLDLNAPAPIPATNDPLSVPLPGPESYEKPKTTPLIEHIRAQKTANAEKVAAAKGKSTTGSAGSSSRASASSSASTTPGEGTPRNAKRTERRARERAAKQAAAAQAAAQGDKGKEKEKEELKQTPVLLKRAEAAPNPKLMRRNSSTPAAAATSASANASPAKAEEKQSEKPKERERRPPRGNAANIANLIQRDLGMASGGRRGRGRHGSPAAAATTASADSTAPTSTAADPATPASSTPSQQPSTPTTSAPPSPGAARNPPNRGPRERGENRMSRRERARAKLEREDSSNINSPAAANPPTPSILKKNQPGLSNATAASSAMATPPVPTVLKREPTAQAPVAASSSSNNTTGNSSTTTSTAPLTTTPAATNPPTTSTTPPARNITPPAQQQQHSQSPHRPPTGPRGGAQNIPRGPIHGNAAPHARGGRGGPINIPPAHHVPPAPMGPARGGRGGRGAMSPYRGLPPGPRGGMRGGRGPIVLPASQGGTGASLVKRATAPAGGSSGPGNNGAAGGSAGGAENS